jgi:ketosteroid isomerase-like protein
MYYAWNEALSRNDAAALTAFYAPDAVIESPLIPHLMGKDQGLCRGQEEIRTFGEH